MKAAEIKEEVRNNYAKIAKQHKSNSTSKNTCCSGSPCGGSSNLAQGISKKIGYTEEELKAVPDGANLGLGCGNPVALASLQEGEVVLDLGSGAGFDSFLAARKVGKKGKVIGVDMTPEMIEKARENAQKGNYLNVEFKLGDIENLPVADKSIDVIISNCVINLSPDKKKVFKEAFRVLKPGGRFFISDIVLTEAIPDIIINSIEAYVGCISGAIMKDEYIKAIKAAGFQKVKIIDETSSFVEEMLNESTAKELAKDWTMSPEMISKLASSVVSMKVYGQKA